MKLAKYRHPNGSVGVGIINDFELVPLDLAGRQNNCLADILESDEPRQVAEFLSNTDKQLSLGKVTLLPPIDRQEVWAAGSTYERGQQARMEISSLANLCYERVYASPRPELFFKASPHRVVGPGQPVRMRRDSKWTVPEPELALVLNSHLQLVGYTIGNDVSARDIESENPLFLPQAKVYDACCGLGPCVTLRDAMPDLDDVTIEIWVMRDEQPVFEGKSRVGEIVRPLEQLIQWLGEENSFPNGVFLLTGSGVVPRRDFTLHAGDMIEITVTGIGTLIQPVAQG